MATNLIKKLTQEHPDEFLSLIKSTDPSFRFRIFADYIEDMNLDMLEYLLAEIEFQIKIKKCLTNKK